MPLVAQCPQCARHSEAAQKISVVLSHRLRSPPPVPQARLAQCSVGEILPREGAGGCRRAGRCHPVIDQFVDALWLEEGLSRNTLAAYRRDLARYLDWTASKGITSPDQVTETDTAQAFSHFSWQHTMGNLIVVDLQGVNYILTDPQIHTADAVDSIGLGNLGLRGMAAFFCTHRCNEICRRLSLRSFESVATSASSSASSAPVASAAASAAAESSV